MVGAVEDVFWLCQPSSGFVARDLYGGKLCAALDRQHPEDFYDVKLLLDAQELGPSHFQWVYRVFTEP